MSRPTIAEIDRLAIHQNFAQLKARVGEAILCPTVKADAYGHGSLLFSRELAQLGVGHWGVHSLEEALALREGGIEGEILILGGSYPKEIPFLHQYRVTPILHHLQNFKALLTEQKAYLKCQKSADKKPLQVHVKLDTGMGRLGFLPKDVQAFLEAYSQQKDIQISGIFAHLPKSKDKAYSLKQKAVYEDCLRAFANVGIHHPIRHHTNSTASILYSELRYDWVRPGLVLYGIYPHDELKTHLDLKPVMRFVSQIISIRTIPEGVGLSYDHIFTTKRPSKIATLPVGYADGYPRACGNRAKVLVAGKRAPIVGRVCMDMCLVDVTDIDEAQIGSRVVLFGQEGAEIHVAQSPQPPSVSEIAELNQTIPYEVLCGISPRVPRILV